ncbi:MAG: hypothetical protein KF773_29395 [Deltaproteobacteria bacterium]|nr:hypothetical protein [Deltaproteobacteria bacterium]
MQSFDTEPLSQVLAAPVAGTRLALGRSLWASAECTGCARAPWPAPDGAHLGSGEQLRVVTTS